jgi:dUTP pyrophosphatase
MTQETLDKLTLLQDSLNELITPNWKQNRTELDFMIASTQEMAELIDSEATEIVVIDGKEETIKHGTGWKWWKGNNGGVTTDSVKWNKLHPAVIANIKIELTDLLFFTLSQKSLGDMSDPLGDIELNNNDWVNFVTISAFNLLQQPGNALKLVLLLAEKMDFNISAYYIAKHTLNHIRQLTGYKDGTNVKVNDGVEDNELLHDIIDGIRISDIEQDFNGVADKIITDVYDVFKVNKADRMNILKWAELIVDTIPSDDLIPEIEE